MAKSDNFFGIRTGSTKSLTFSRYRGKQVTKDRVSHVTNPQTAAQMKQRLIFPLVSNFVTQWKGILNHSFEGVEEGYESLKAARQANLRKDALTVAAYVPKGGMSCGLANFVMSKGTIAPVTLTEIDDAGAYISNASITKLYDGDTAPTTGTKITEEQLEYIVSLMPDNIKNSDQITICYMEKTETIKAQNSGGETYQYPVLQPAVARLVLNPDRFSENSDVIWDSDGALQIGLLTLEVQNSRLHITGATNLGMMCVILSRQDDNVWRRSTARMEYIDYPENTIADVIDSYLNSSNSSSEKYLNNGTDAVGVQGSFETKDWE